MGLKRPSVASARVSASEGHMRHTKEEGQSEDLTNALDGVLMSSLSTVVFLSHGQ